MAEAVSSSERLFSGLDNLSAEAEKLIALKKLLQSGSTDYGPSFKHVISEIRQEVMVLYSLLNEMESEFELNEEIAKSLKELQGTAEEEQKEAQYFLTVLSSHHNGWESCFAESEKHDECQPVNGKKTPKASELEGFPSEMGTMIREGFENVPVGFAETEKHACKPERGKKPTKAPELELPQKMPVVTPEDLQKVPVYMKGRITCDQVNTVVNNLNRAVTAKYKIRHQAPSSMNAADRNLYYRYVKEENKDTEGCYFVVEDDIKLFTCMKMDKRFHQIIVILRHSKRLKVIRTSGIIRYVIC